MPPMQTELEPAPRPRLTELEPGAVVAERVLKDAEPLRSDPERMRQFYGEMGVQRVTLRALPSKGNHQLCAWDERVQPSGSYKSRGASNAVLCTNPDDEISTFSTGNHGASVAIAGKRRGQKVVAQVTETIISEKENLLENAGAIVSKEHPLTGERHKNFIDTEKAARFASKQEGVALIPPFGHPDVIAGQCSAGFEMVDEIIAKGLADKKVVIPVPVAGAGYINGIAIAVWEAKRDGRLGSDVHVVAVQPEGTDAMNRARNKIKNGEDPANLFGPQGPDKDCDALAITEESLSPLTMSVALDTEFVEEFYTIDKASIGRAMRELKHLSGGVPVEPAAALAYAFAQNFAEQFPADGVDVDPITFILPITGGNVSRATENKYESAANRAEFERMPNEYLERDVFGEEEVRQVGRTALKKPNALSALFDRGQSTNLPRHSVTKHKLAADVGVDLAEVQETFRRQLADMGVELLN